MARKQRTPTPDVATWNGDTLVSISEAVAFMAWPAYGPRDDEQGAPYDERRARDAARHLLRDHLRKGTLTLANAHARRMRVGELGRFLRKRFPGRFNEMPADLIVALRGVEARMRAGDVYEAPVLPGDLPRCHEAIKHLSVEVSALRRDLNAAQLRIGELEPDAKRWRGHKEKLRLNAQRPRKV